MTCFAIHILKSSRQWLIKLCYVKVIFIFVDHENTIVSVERARQTVESGIRQKQENEDYYFRAYPVSELVFLVLISSNNYIIVLPISKCQLFVAFNN